MSRLEDLSAQALLRAPAQPAIEFHGRWFNWGEMRQVAERVAALVEASGADPCAAVALMPRTRPSPMAAMLGLISQGRTIQMVYVYQKPAGIIRDIDRLKPAVLVAAAEDFSDEIRAALLQRRIAAVALTEMDAVAIPGLELSLAAAYLETRARPQIETLTSGTTGPPKQFPLDYDLIAGYLVGLNLHSAGSQAAAEDIPFLHYAPLGNISGIYGSIPVMFSGRRAVLLERFSVPGWIDFVRRHHPRFVGIPTAGVQMVLDANVPPEDLIGVEALLTGAAPLDPTVHRAFEERYGIPILLSYGATEFAGPVTAMSLELYRQWRDKKFGSVGRAIGGAELRVIDPDTGAVLPAGEEGVLEVSVPRMGPRWIRTTDLVRIDEDGFVFHCGRADGAINRGGFKLLPETIERALMLHQAVSAAAVVAMPDKRLGHVPAAVIQFKPGVAQPTVAELEEHLRNHVLATHIPVAWRFDSVPRTPSLKVDRGAARNLFQPGDA
jgi:long-chain acyl-CoA synthetase